MQCLPFPEYAHPQGSLNVANYLTEDLIKPDLGPKSYIATGRYAPPYTLTSTHFACLLHGLFNATPLQHAPQDKTSVLSCLIR